MSTQLPKQRTPVLLLKTKSVPKDHYEELFSGAESQYDPSFVPVLEHHFKEDIISWLKATILNHGFSRRANRDTPTKSQDSFGGLIFTSQRAVEAFSAIVDEIGPEQRDALLPESLPLYCVGPATARGIRALGLPCQVLGEETGNGEALAKFMLDHYNGLPATQRAANGHNLPLLFLVGEVRRDIIPKTLQSLDLEQATRIGVDERVVYETGEMESFHLDFSKSVAENASAGVRDQWVVVFSPQGCMAMLRCLGWLDSATGRYNPELAKGQSMNTYVATIGPTTQNYLIKEFGFQPHVSAEKPSAEGILAAIEAYRRL
ncbi:uroporphyrinogen-III synthase [Delphinella strobiligena]|nr:uroporphyrinogen-III synthase [Delphinella strobiligena]